MQEPWVPIDELRPVVHTPPRERDGELIFEAPTEEVAIAGDVGFVRRVLAQCDGQRTVAEIAAQLDGDPAEVRELVTSLVAHGVISDCTHVWRHFHRQSSLAAGLFRQLSDDQLEAMMRERFEPDHAESFHPLQPEDSALGELASRRRSAQPQGGAREVTYAELSSVLALMYGRPEGTARPLPSGGAIYPLLVHMLVRRPLPPLDPGLWWYEPERGGLWLVREGALDTKGLFLPHPTTDPLISFGHPIVFVSAELERPSRKYGNRAYRFALMEIGAALQNAYLMGAQLELPVRAVGGVVEDAVDAFLELPDHAHALLAVLLGN